MRGFEDAAREGLVWVTVGDDGGVTGVGAPVRVEVVVVIDDGDEDGDGARVCLKWEKRFGMSMSSRSGT